MGLADAFSKEDRYLVKFTDFFNLVKQAAKYENVMNAVNCNVPHSYIREMVTGKPEEHEATTIKTINVTINAEDIEEALKKAQETVFAEVFPIKVDSEE